MDCHLYFYIYLESGKLPVIYVNHIVYKWLRDRGRAITRTPASINGEPLYEYRCAVATLYEDAEGSRSKIGAGVSGCYLLRRGPWGVE
jgi:hypothetical protein